MDHLRADARLLAAADQASSAADQTLSDTAQTPRALEAYTGQTPVREGQRTSSY
jgi:hypothetical protein